MVHKNPKSRFNIRLVKAMKSCPEYLNKDLVAKERFLVEKMNSRRRWRRKDLAMAKYQIILIQSSNIIDKWLRNL